MWHSVLGTSTVGIRHSWDWLGWRDFPASGSRDCVLWFGSLPIPAMPARDSHDPSPVHGPGPVPPKNPQGIAPEKSINRGWAGGTRPGEERGGQQEQPLVLHCGDPGAHPLPQPWRDRGKWGKNLLNDGLDEENSPAVGLCRHTLTFRCSIGLFRLCHSVTVCAPVPECSSFPPTPLG